MVVAGVCTCITFLPVCPVANRGILLPMLPSNGASFLISEVLSNAQAQLFYLIQLFGLSISTYILGASINGLASNNHDTKRRR